MKRLWILPFWLAAAVAAQPVALLRAYSTNDYQHPRPLLDALAHRFGNIDADI